MTAIVAESQGQQHHTDDHADNDEEIDHKSFNEKQELLSSPLPEDNEALTISLAFIHRYLQKCETYLRAQCHLQNFWIFSHTSTIVGTFLHAFALATGNEHLKYSSYAFTIWGTIITYIVVLYRSNVEEQVNINEEKEEVILKPTVMCVSELMKNENAQLLGYVCLWLFTEHTIVKLIPFAIYSVINLSSYFTTELIPGSPFSVALLPLLNYFEMPLLILASHFDLVAIGLLTNESISTKNGYPLVIYLAIWSLRYENSEISRSSIKSIVTVIDKIMLLSFVPQRAQDEYRLWRSYCTFMIPVKSTISLQDSGTTPSKKDHDDNDEYQESNDEEE